MVSSSHEALHWVFQKDPALLTRAFQNVLRVPFPEPRDFAVLNTDVTEIEPVERRVTHCCEPVLVVITQSSATARWAARPIRRGLPGWDSLTVRPLVIGPGNVPAIASSWRPRGTFRSPCCRP
ncbi:hypothetical protein GCM10010220_39560 [Streptomyces parvulus]|nr:hypothetical protein GCM10010220_39560 [Streptomyces parvulus]